MIRIEATGNKFKPRWPGTFLEVSGGFGNGGYGEVHLVIDQAGETLAMGWFDAETVIAAIRKEVAGA